MVDGSQFVRVVFLRRNIKEPFTYSIPDNLLNQFDDSLSLVGIPVVVPLNTKLTVGVIVDSQETLSDQDCATPDSLKPVKDTIPNFYSIPDELVELGRWIADYYACPINQVFRSILPPKYLPTPVPGHEVIDKDSPLLDNLSEEFGDSTISEDELFQSLDGSKSEKEQKRTKMVEESVLEPTVIFREAKIRPRRLQHVELSASDDRVEEFRSNAGGRQKELLDFMQEKQESFRRDLPQSLRRTDLLRRLEEEGLIRLKEKRSERKPHEAAENEPESVDFELTDEQKAVMNSVEPALQDPTFETHLIHGVTGSGKTEVYFRLAKQALSQDRTVLVLVPEITLATFMVDRFRERFGDDLAILHSGLSEGERLDEWSRVASKDANVILGVQSSVLAPLPDLGLIVVDEEHDSSYKSGQSPRYHARDTAIMRAKINEIPVVLGSATPSIESYANTQKGRYELHEMRSRPQEGSLPNVLINDLRGEDNFLTDNVIDTTQSVLDKGNKAIWFLNRRGFSNFVLCDNCGHVESCGQCNVSLTIHGSPGELRCHYCGYSEPMPDRCSDCNQPELDTVGTGTEKLTEYANELYPDITIIRMDSDTVSKKDARYEKLEEFKRSSPVLLIGTQMVTKGLDFEDVDFVAVVHADTGLQFPDFRSGERTFQQLVQVCGRAGRRKSNAEVQIQTYNPGHYAILYGKNQDYESFYEEEVSNRKPFHYPPFSRLVNVIARGDQEHQVSTALNKLRSRISVPDDADILGPSPCGIDYVQNQYRWHLLFRGTFNMQWRRSFRDKLDSLDSPVTLVADVDPVDVM